MKLKIYENEQEFPLLSTFHSLHQFLPFISPPIPYYVQ